MTISSFSLKKKEKKKIEVELVLKYIEEVKKIEKSTLKTLCLFNLYKSLEILFY